MQGGNLAHEMDKRDGHPLYQSKPLKANSSSVVSNKIKSLQKKRHDLFMSTRKKLLTFSRDTSS